MSLSNDVSQERVVTSEQQALTLIIGRCPYFHLLYFIA